MWSFAFSSSPNSYYTAILPLFFRATRSLAVAQSHEWTRTTFINSYDFRPVESPFSLDKQRLKELRTHLSWGVVNCLVYTVVSLTFLFIWLVSISLMVEEKKKRVDSTRPIKQDNENDDETTQTFTAGWILFLFCHPVELAILFSNV